jgi:hypothetical protein
MAIILYRLRIQFERSQSDDLEHGDSGAMRRRHDCSQGCRSSAPWAEVKCPPSNCYSPSQ